MRFLVVLASYNHILLEFGLGSQIKPGSSSGEVCSLHQKLYEFSSLEICDIAQMVPKQALVLSYFRCDHSYHRKRRLSRDGGLSVTVIICPPFGES